MGTQSEPNPPSPPAAHPALLPAEFWSALTNEQWLVENHKVAVTKLPLAGLPAAASTASLASLVSSASAVSLASLGGATEGSEATGADEVRACRAQGRVGGWEAAAKCGALPGCGLLCSSCVGSRRICCPFSPCLIR